MDLLKLFLANKRISTDSRNIVTHSLFFALKGDFFNGNEFALDALDKGASYAIVDDPSIQGDQIIHVSNVLHALQQLASDYRDYLGIPIIGITGSNGKTTTKELLYSVLSKKYNVHYTQGNLNNHIGVPLTLLQMNESHEIAIIEMGANHVFEIKNLCEIAKPDFGVITNIGKAHIGEFGSFENIIKAKTELYDYIESMNKMIFVNASDPLLVDLARNRSCKSISYGNSPDSIARALTWEMNDALRARLDLGGNSYNVKSNLFGTYNLSNILVSAAVGLFFDMSPEMIVEGIESYIPNNKRSEIRVTHSNKLLLDMYNANPSSMNAALDDFLTMVTDGYQKLCILGDMLELGGESEVEHKRIINRLRESKIRTWLVGPQFSKFDSEKWAEKRFLNVSDCVEHAKSNPLNNHFIILKGSRGIQLEKLVDFL